MNIKKIIMYSVIIGLMQSLSAAPTKEEVAGMKKIVGYFPNWGVYGGHRKYYVNKIPFEKLTHIQVAFAGIEAETFKVKSPDAWADFDNPYGESWNSKYKGNYGQLRKLKVAYPHISVLVSIGGWTLSGQFALLSNDSDRAKFAKSAVEFMVANDLDGIDIDWEFPTKVRQPDKIDNQNDEGTPYETAKSKQYFTLTLKELRKQLDAQGAADNGRYYQLTAAVGSSSALINATEPGKYIEYLDFLNIMSYDMHGAWEDRTNHQSPIFANPNLPDDNLTIENAANLLVNTYKVEKSKIIIGSPFYSRGWKGVECKDGATVSYTDSSWKQITKKVSNTMIKGKDGEDLPGLYCYASGGAAGRWDGGRAAGVNAWYDIVNHMIDKDGFKAYRDTYSKVPYLYNKTKKEFYTYEDEISAQARVDFVKDNDYGGIIIWELSADTRTELGDPDRSLLNVIYNGFYNDTNLTTKVSDKVKTVDNNKSLNIQKEAEIIKADKNATNGAASALGIPAFDPDHGPKWNKHYGKGEQVSNSTEICTAQWWTHTDPKDDKKDWICTVTGENQALSSVAEADVNKSIADANNLAKILKSGKLIEDDISSIESNTIKTTQVASTAANLSKEANAAPAAVDPTPPSLDEIKNAVAKENECHNGQVYLLGESCLSDDGQWYEFKWWTSYKGNIELSMKKIEASDVSKEVKIIAANGIPTWSLSTTYSEKGMKVVYNSYVYESRWWTQGDMPEPFVSSTAWKYLGLANFEQTPTYKGVQAPTVDYIKNVKLADSNKTIIRSDDKKSTTATLDSESKKTIITEATPTDENITMIIGGNDKFFMPFVDTTMWPPYDYSKGIKAGVKNFALSFVNSSSGVCSPTWGNYASYTIENTTLNLPEHIKTITKNGGMVMISFGGATAHHNELPYTCKNPEDLAKAYQEVIDKTGVKMLDFDIEGANSYDKIRVQRRMEAIKIIQDKNSDVEISFTLATMPTGLLKASGLMILKTAIAKGVEIKMVNLMLMDYGYSFPAKTAGGYKMSAYSIQALQSVNSQLKAILPSTYQEVEGNHYNMLGAIPMIGRNDTLNEYFYRQDAEKLREWCDLVGVRMTSMWSLNRDKPISSSEGDSSMLFISTKLPKTDTEGGYGTTDKYEFSRILKRGGN